MTELHALGMGRRRWVSERMQSRIVTASDASSDLKHDGCESSLTIANK